LNTAKVDFPRPFKTVKTRKCMSWQKCNPYAVI